MHTLRFSAAKVWANYLLAIAAAVVVVIVLTLLWDRTVMVGGIGGIVAVTGMLLVGTIKRSSKQDPVLVVGQAGLEVGVLDIGRIPWSAVQSARIAGMPWVNGQRLVLEYTGTAPKVGFMDKLNWGIYAKQKGPLVRLTLGFLDQTDQSISDVKDTLSRKVAVPGA